MADHYPFELQPLPYAYDALEPYIDTETMHLHHDKHLGTYVENLNKTLANYPRFHDWSLTQLLTNLGRIPRPIQTAVRNNGGGVYNHNLYFSGMTPDSTREPVGALADAIMQQFGSYDIFKQRLKQAGLDRFGSGWAWLVSDGAGKLQILSTPNQDVPLPLCPIVVMDVWEHAYYLKYHNLRANYIDNWFNTINWPVANERYLSCLGGPRFYS
nr:superoxide dismutase [Hydrogenoanaerobacterium sp.]